MERDELKKAMEEVMEESRKKFWVDPETHFLHHKKFEDWNKIIGLAKKSIIVSFVTGFMAGLIGIFWLGFKAYMAIKSNN